MTPPGPRLKGMAPVLSPPRSALAAFSPSSRRQAVPALYKRQDPGAEFVAGGGSADMAVTSDAASIAIMHYGHLARLSGPACREGGQISPGIHQSGKALPNT